MCDARALLIPCQLKLKQILRLESSSVTFAVPVPLGSPFGLSCPPVIFTVNVLFDDPRAAAVKAIIATSANAIGTSFFMQRSLRACGPVDHRTMVVGPR